MRGFPTCSEQYQKQRVAIRASLLVRHRSPRQQYQPVLSRIGPCDENRPSHGVPVQQRHTHMKQ